jgi:hypothetical protein
MSTSMHPCVPARIQASKQLYNPQHRDGGDYEGEARQAGGAGEARYHRFGKALQLNGG